MSNLNPAHTFNGNHGTARTFRAWTPAETDLVVVATPLQETTTPAGESETTTKDAIFNTATGATVHLEAHVAANQAATYSTPDTTLADVDAGGRVTWKANGTARILATTARGTARVDVAVSQTTGQTTKVFNRYAADSAAYAASHAIDDKLAALTASDANKRILATADYGAKVWTRSPTCWAYGLDLTCWPVGNSYQDRQGATLITDQCVYTTEHFEIPNGTKLYFLDNANTVYERTVANSAHVPSGYAYEGDDRISILDSPLPTAITPALFLPTNWPVYFPSIFTGASDEATKPRCPIPVIWCDGEHKALVREWYKTADVAGVAYNYTSPPTDAHRATFAETGVGGDSNGAPSLALGGRLVILGPLAEQTTASQGRVSAFNAVIDGLGGASHVATVPLNSFANY